MVVVSISEVFRLYDVYAGDSREVQRAKQDKDALKGVVLYQQGVFLTPTAFIE